MPEEIHRFAVTDKVIFLLFSFSFWPIDKMRSLAHLRLLLLIGLNNISTLSCMRGARARSLLLLLLLLLLRCTLAGLCVKSKGKGKKSKPNRIRDET